MRFPGPPLVGHLPVSSPLAAPLWAAQPVAAHPLVARPPAVRPLVASPLGAYLPLAVHPAGELLLPAAAPLLFVKQWVPL